MVEVVSFQGLTYNKKKVGNLDDVMSPPYDIISEEMQEELYARHPYNFVRLILGKQFPDDTEKNNRYTRAKHDFETWIKESILISTDKPAIYPYKIEYMLDNQLKTMSGFFVLLKLDPEYKMVKAHEKTLSKPKADRLNLMRACHANLEPIQLLYIDEDDRIQKTIDDAIREAPLISVKGYDTFTHKLWKLEDDRVISFIQQELKDQVLFIADGHHRYQTAINYAEEMRKKTGNQSADASFNYRMVILANMFNEGLAILPTHRLIKMQGISIEKLLPKLEEYFTVEETMVPSEKKDYGSLVTSIKTVLKTEKDHKFVLYLKDRYYLLTLKDETVMDTFASDRSTTWRKLDVSILHKIVIEHIFGITQENLEDHVKYTRDDEEALRFVDEGRFDLSILMNPTRISELKKIAEAGEHMPQKSTYFLPKMLSGLVIYKMKEE